MRVTHLLPRLPPPPEGVGTYALALAGALRDRLGVESRFLLPAPHGEGREAGGFPVDSVAAEAGALAERLAGGKETVLLHYVNYGFEPRGCPRWLAAGLERWKRGHPGARLATMFHEVWASGPPWRSSFWLHPVQRSLAARVARVSDGATTSLELYADLVSRYRRERPTVLPVFSTVGEPPNPPPFSARAPRLVVFGGRGARAKAYGPLAGLLEFAGHCLSIEEIADVGPPLAHLPARVGPARVVAHGELPADAVSRLLLECRAGFIAYPRYFLPKSTIFAAYAAHGLLAVQGWTETFERPEGELAAGQHFWSPPDELAEEPALLAAAAGRWYQGHALARQAEIFGGLLAP